MLTTIDRRVELLKQHGADEIIVLHFTEEMSRQTPEEFIEETLLRTLGAVRVVVGHNFRFGHRAAGGVELLRAYDLEVDEVDLLTDGETVSSTYIRECIAHGDVEIAAKALGRPHFVEGPIVRGDARGRTLGFPTANVGVDHRIAIPQDGVYAGHVRRAGQSSIAAISVGTNPTFDGVHRRVEAYLIDQGHDLDLYDEHLEVAFEHRLRGMEKFASVDDLVAQMTKDVAAARARLH
jgi:riboflavin kinase/FMN adenylyltransferase